MILLSILGLKGGLMEGMALEGMWEHGVFGITVVSYLYIAVGVVYLDG
jgi:hypothetical protein